MRAIQTHLQILPEMLKEVVSQMYGSRGLISNFGAHATRPGRVSKLYDYFVQMRTNQEQRLALQKPVGKLTA